MWLLIVDHARVAACTAAAGATLVAGVCFLQNATPPDVTLLRAATVFVLTYAACLGFLVVYQRAVVRALAQEYKDAKYARKAAMAAARAEALAEATRGDDATDSLTAQQA